MNDLQMTQLAAQVLGLQVEGLAKKYIAQGVSNVALVYINDKGGSSVFDPLNKSEDAFNILIALQMDLDLNTLPHVHVIWFDEDEELHTHHTVLTTEPRAGVRRLIVEAAVKVAEQKKQPPEGG